MRLLTFNTLFRGDVRARLRALAPLLDCYDVVCLQEVMFRRNARLLSRTFAHFSGFGGVLLRGGLVMLSQRPIVGSRFVRYPFSAPLRPELIMRKGVQIASVDGVTVVNTHLSAHAARIQDRELEFLAGVASGLEGPLVVVGDLNVSRRRLQKFLDISGLIDPLAGDARPTYRPTPEFPSPPAFDHILTRGGITAQARIVLQDPIHLPDGRQTFLSDHYGVEADITARRSRDREG
ncbi:endonuclease/exonuclease/phosphatase family protein [Actinoplanes sp. NPDC023714]|uniref:endonuclease/exonuclease/phosphatase family protein n=1 Tax=Actinoplanes sp. NPDC023714 TaxID=3154322 RepID=UPI0033C24FCC